VSQTVPAGSGPLDPEAWVGVALPVLRLTVSRDDLVRYAGASTDFNPIHYSDRRAQALGLPGVVAHGLLTMGLALRAVTAWVGHPQAVLSYAARFIRPVVVPDDDRGAELTVQGRVQDCRSGRLVVGLEVTCQGQPVLGRVTVEVDASQLGSVPPPVESSPLGSVPPPGDASSLGSVPSELESSPLGSVPPPVEASPLGSVGARSESSRSGPSRPRGEA
jgi:acyl dehydratase